MAEKLTSRFLETVKPGQARAEYPDALLPGLRLIVQSTGAKSWAVRYRHGRRTRKHTLGPYPAVDLKAARDLGAKALRAVAEGRDPGREKLEAREVAPDTVAAIVRQFVDLHCQRANRPKTAAETQRLLEVNVLPRWRGRLAREITRRDVIELLDRLVEGGTPITANRTFSALRKCFTWATSRDILVASPCAGIKPPSKEQSRDRILSDAELKAAWQAADRIGGPFGMLVKLLILTGQRRDEVAGMRWSEIDLNTQLWTIAKERTKNNQPHAVPLSGSAVAILTALPLIAGSDFVLTTTGAAASNGYSKGKRRLDALLPSDMPPWRLHDLRRTLASGMARLGVNLPVIEKVLNHLSGSFGGIVGVYQRHDFAAEKRTALERWADHVEQLISGEPAKVLPLRVRQ
jgi:integrase